MIGAILAQIIGEDDLKKEQCAQVIKDVLKQMGHEDKYSDDIFDMLFSQIDPENKGVITHRQICELINLMVFGV